MTEPAELKGSDTGRSQALARLHFLTDARRQRWGSATVSPSARQTLWDPPGQRKELRG